MVMEWSPVLGTVREFIDYSLFIAGILAIYYFIKFWTIGGKSKEDQEKDSEAFRKWVKDKWDANKAAKKTREEKEKKEKEKKHKKDLVSPIKKNLVDCIEACSEAVDALDRANRPAVVSAADKFNKEIKSAWANLRLLRRNLEGDDKDKIHKQILVVESIKQKVEDEIKGKLPKTVTPTWKADVGPIRGAVMSVRASCGTVFKELEQFHQ